MKIAFVALLWTTAGLAIVAIPIVNQALLTASTSILLGLGVGMFSSTILTRYTVFEASLGWVLGFCVTVYTGYYMLQTLL